MHDKKLYGTATVGTKGQVVIPVEAREELGIKTGDRLYVVCSNAHQWVGLIKEEQLRVMIDRSTDSLETFKDALGQERD